jgi:hypothetical protein
MQSKRLTTLLIAACLFVHCFPASVLPQSPQVKFENIIIQASKPYAKLAGDIKALGGTITYQYKHLDAIAARVPSNAMDMLRSMAGSAQIVKDPIIAAPSPRSGVRSTRGRASSRITNFSSFPPSAAGPYALNNLGLNLAGLHSKGYTGAGVIVAVVDSGIRPGYPVLESDKSVIGGIDFVGDGLGFSNPQNDPHGTFIAGLISGNTMIDVSNTLLASSVEEHFPGALSGGNLPLIGTAPASSIYAVRVFGINAAAGAPESRIIAAIDHLIDLKLKYLKGEPGGLNIAVSNLSLGNTTLYAARDVFDRSIDELIAAGIVPVISAGDAGPSGLTVSSPATSVSSIAVGSISPAANERVEQDVLNGLGYGVRFRPSSITQAAWFSARGPNADGRISPDVVGIGVANFGQGYSSSDSVDLVSGSSFSAPLIAGVAAVLQQAFPDANAAHVRNAIIGSGNPYVVGPGFTSRDQGRGVPDAQVAFNHFSKFSGALPVIPKAHSSVATNLLVAGVRVDHGMVNKHTGKLAPAERFELFYDIKPNTSQVVITISNFKSGPDVSKGNIFPEEIYFLVHSAKTSQIGAFGDYLNLGNPFITGGAFTINKPEPGIMRITLSGSWTNESKVSADVAVQSTTGPESPFTTQGIVRNQEQIVFPVTIPAGVSLAEFRLFFRNDWGNFPTSDVDMILFDPNLVANSTGATLNDPELVNVSNPLPGTWSVVIVGFSIPTGSDKYELRVSLDGKVIK